MKFILPVFLITMNYAQESNEVGDIVSTNTERKVYASENSVKRNEFYQAQANGFKIEKVIELRSFEYRGEEIVRINQEQFSVLKTYDKGNGNIELTLLKGVNQSGSTQVNRIN